MWNWRIGLVYAILFLGTSVVAMGCGTNQHSSSQTSGYYLSSALWDSPEVSVCWENPSSDNLQGRELVEREVVSQFNQRTPLKFTGWSEECREANIKVRIEDSHPHTKGLGNRIDGVSSGMVLNFDFKNWSQSCQRYREDCIGSIAVHEFGHAAALSHEHNRSDRPEDCNKDVQGSNGDTTVASFDRQSVMNYCNPHYNNGGVLSAGDILTINQAYAK